MTWTIPPKNLNRGLVLKPDRGRRGVGGGEEGHKGPKPYSKFVRRFSELSETTAEYEEGDLSADEEEEEEFKRQLEEYK